MVDEPVSPEAIDDEFIRVMMEELAWRHPAPPAVRSRSAAGAAAGHRDAGTPSAKVATAGPGGPAAAGQWHLRIMEKDGVEHVVPLSEAPITIGRSRSNSVIVQCPQVSRRHAQVWLEEGWPRIVDLSGRWHMKINGVKMPGSSLQNGDVIEIGSVRILVEQSAANTPASS